MKGVRSLLACLGLVCEALGCQTPPDVRSPAPELALPPEQGRKLWSEAEQVFQSRCVVCHGCYDAPCQLKLGSYEGIERGASPDLVYDATRLLAAEPTRLGVDAHDRAEWRAKNFHPVLPEGTQADPRASLLVRMLELKQAHPLTSALDLSKEFTLELDRKQTCTEAKDFDDFARKHPTWGMPYAFPGLSADEQRVLLDWVRAGAPHSDLPPEPPALSQAVADWERFLNEGSLKGQLVGRYIFEHLFLASIRFEGAPPNEHGSPRLFRLVRSSSASGAIREIPTRRPFEDPKVARVYYRFQERPDEPLEKTVMPYALGPARLARYKKLFLETPYEVSALPSYEPAISANPFRAFAALPVDSRYRFMLEEAKYTMMGFIKGPVCRGQVALNVIEDRFWIYFVSPEVPWHADESAFLAETKLDLDMPAKSGSNAFPTAWLGYGKEHARYVDKKAEFFERETGDGRGVTPSMIWDGDGTNDNAALTVLRHFDSATVEKGLIGTPPKTAWVVDYPLLERIHYLLVAGFDVYGNVMHQLTTRLYMDFLRMEGETAFLALLPPARRRELVELWYRGVTGSTKERVLHDLVGLEGKPQIAYKTATPELEAFAWLGARVAKVARHDFDLSRIDDDALRAELTRLAAVRGRAASALPEDSFLAVELEPSGTRYFSVLRDSAHSNVAELFSEDKRRLPEEDELTVVSGLLGAYPNALFSLKRSELKELVDAVGRLDGADAYHAFRARFGLLRSSPSFWSFSDLMNAAHRKSSPSEHGFFDYNRLEAF